MKKIFLCIFLLVTINTANARHGHHYSSGHHHHHYHPHYNDHYSYHYSYYGDDDAAAYILGGLLVGSLLVYYSRPYEPYQRHIIAPLTGHVAYTLEYAKTGESWQAKQGPAVTIIATQDGPIPCRQYQINQAPTGWACRRNGNWYASN